ncbi:hypothetical protein Elgi_67340 [Paenibacillus elgii]|uniref:P-loop NTPase fold protein n=1 Tax=Paenibacillus elgii TaxID=189691 RepID=UPI002D7BD02A|nr:hypothetical protein Elgi_67340 [Paenibacillus elgii]
MANRNSGAADRSSEIFIGARNLGKEVYNIMPTYNLLLRQIEQIGVQSRTESGRALSDSYFRKDVNNTIGIFGVRGSGKTSVLFTLINELNPFGSVGTQITPNMVLGIVEPDHFGDNTKIMGSIVGLLKKMTDRQLAHIEKLGQGHVPGFYDYFTKGMFRPNNPLQSSLNELIEYHMYTENEYRQMLIHNYDDLATHIKKSARLLTPDIEFKEKLNQLISHLVSNQRELLKNVNISDEETPEPLIFLFIDDVDLKMKRSRELIESILQYANHPNVVTVLSGDYEILLEAIALALIQDEGLHTSNLHVNFRANDQMSIKERKLMLAHEYVKKIIPPARRHQLLQWNENTIPQFAFGERTLMNQLDRLFGQKSLFGYRQNHVKELLPIIKSYSIFDRTPRGIVNVYYHIHEINERFPELWKTDRERTDEEKKERFMTVKSLVDTILLSSARFAAVQRTILEQYIQWGQDAGSTVLDYTKIKAIAEGEPARERAKYESDLLLPLVIIGEIIHALLEEIRYDDDKRAQVQLSVLRDILRIGNNLKGANRYGKIVGELLSFINFQNGIFFTSILLDHSDWLLYELGESAEQTTSLKEKREQWLLTTINTLLNQGKDKGVLARLYYEQYIRSKLNGQHLNDPRIILDFLLEASASVGQYVYYKTLYEYPPNSQPWSKLKMGSHNTRYALDLFIYLIIEIKSWDESRFESVLKSKEKSQDPLDHLDTKKPPASRLRSVLATLMKKQNTNEPFTPAQRNRINKLIDEFYNALFDGIRTNIANNKFNVEWKDEATAANAVVVFKKGPDGVTRTKYKQTKQIVNNINEKQESYAVYSHRRYHVEELAEDYAVWYGRKEANTLLQAMSTLAYMAPSELEPDDLWVLRHLDFYLKRVNDAVHVDDAYEAIKEEMRRKLDQGFKVAMEFVVTDLIALGIELDDEEDLDGDA